MSEVAARYEAVAGVLGLPLGIAGAVVEAEIRLVFATDSEKRFTAQVLRLAGQLGWRGYHIHNARRSEPGFPDLTLVRFPRLLFAELKLDGPGHDLTIDQAWWLRELGRCPGCEAYRWTPSMEAEIVRLLR